MDLKENPPLPERKLSALVRKSRNFGAEQLEKYLGIRFPKSPYKVNPHVFNTIALNIFHPELAALVARHRKGSGGVYDRPYDTFFPFKSTPFRRTEGMDEDGLERYYAAAETERHESMHAYILTENPKLYIELGRDSYPLYEPLNKTNLKEREKYEVYGAINEGIASWAATETILMERLTHWKKEYEVPYVGQKMYTFGRMLHYAGNEEIKINGENINRYYDEFMQKSLEDWEELVESDNIYWEYRTAIVKLGYPQKLLKNLISLRYILGTHFVNEVMKHLRSNGITTAQALDLVIKNPPESLAQVKDPLTFSQGLLSNST